MTDQKRLQVAATVFTATVLVHNADHLRRGGASVSGGVFGVGTLAIVLEVALVVLVFARHRFAAIGAAVGGLGLAAGYVFVHFTPARAWLSDSFLGGRGSTLSIIAAGLEMVGGLILASAGFVVLRRRAESGQDPPSRSVVFGSAAAGRDGDGYRQRHRARRELCQSLGSAFPRAGTSGAGKVIGCSLEVLRFSPQQR